VLSPLDAGCVVVGAIIGVGIFFTPSRVAGLVESPGLVLTAWVAGAILALCGALAFAELGRRYHGNGAQYEVLRDSWGTGPAFVFVFCNATAIQAGAIGIIAIICARNLGVCVWGASPEGWRLKVLTCNLILLVTVANLVGVKSGSRLQNATVFAKVATLVALFGVAAAVAAGLAHLAPASGGPAAGVSEVRAKPVAGWGGVLAALVPVFFSFGGWQHALWLSGEVRDPARSLPRAIFGGVLVVAVVYVGANWAYLELLGHAGVAQSKTLAADAVAAVFPQWGRRAVAGAVAISALGVLNAQLLSGPRLVYGMARDGRFFRSFAVLHPRTGTPVRAILLLGACGLVLLLATGESGVDRLLTGVVFIDGVFFLLTAAALFVLRPKGGGKSLPLVKVAAGVFVLGELGLLVGAHLDENVRGAVWIGVAWIVVAGAVFAGMFRRPARSRPARIDGAGGSD
jgi:APA family basic amino acid/polyamine antiporter